MVMRRFLMATTAAASWVAPGAVIAQTQTSQPPVAAGETTQASPGSEQSSSDVSPNAQTVETPGLQDIIVTAQRRSENVQRAAIAISVVGGADLVGAGITQAQGLQEVVPALTIEDVGPSSASFIRGVGNFSVSVTSDPAVAFNYDGVYIGRLTATSTTFYDLDRVEVLKGPQGTLYGRNATAGAINVLPTQPKLGENSGYATVSYGNYDALIGEGAINVALGDKGAVRVSGTVNHRDGYNSDGTSDDKSRGLRVQFKSELTPALTARLAFDYSHLGGVGTGITYLDTYACNAVTTVCTVTPTGIPRSDGNLSSRSQSFLTARPTRVAGRFNDPFPSLYQNSNFYGSNADIEYDTGAGVLTVIPAVRFDDVRNRNPGGGFPISNDQKDIQYSVEARFAGKLGMFDYTLGMFYYNEDARLHAGTVTGGSTENFQTPTNVKTESYAPFARLTARLTPSLRLVGGIRYTHDHKDFFARTISISESCVAGSICPTAILPVSVPYMSQLPFAIPQTASLSPTVPVVIPGPTPNSLIARTDIVFDNHLSKGKFTYRGAVEFDVAPASLLYGSVETGFRSGGFANSVGYETYQPEYITAFTVGSKNRFFDNRLQLNVEAFYWKYRNQQVAHAGADLAGRNGNFTQNIGSSKIKGVEAEVRLAATRTTVLSADIQYLHARNKSFVYQQAKFLGYPFTNCKVSTNAANATLYDVNCAGLPGYNSPTWSVNLSGEQTVPIAGYNLVFGVDTQYKTKRYTYFDYAPDQIQYANWTTNGQVSFGPDGNKWSISGFVRNIENKRRLSAPIAFIGVVSAYTTAPRTYGVRASVKF